MLSRALTTRSRTARLASRRSIPDTAGDVVMSLAWYRKLREARRERL
jgi:hypothetical protein